MIEPPKMASAPKLQLEAIHCFPIEVINCGSFQELFLKVKSYQYPEIIKILKEELSKLKNLRSLSFFTEYIKPYPNKFQKLSNFENN